MNSQQQTLFAQSVSPETSPKNSPKNSAETSGQGEIWRPGENVAKLLIDNGLITQEQLRHAKRVRDKLHDDYPLSRVLTELRYLDPVKFRAALREHGHQINLGEVLVELGYLTSRDLRAALNAYAQSDERNRSLSGILLDKGLVSEQRLIEVLADQLGFSLEAPIVAEIERPLLEQVTPDWCRRLSAFPLRRDADGVHVVFADPLDAAAREGAEAQFGPVIPAFATRRAIVHVLRELETGGDGAEPADSSDEARVAAEVEELIRGALEAGASKIHIEPAARSASVRLRIDGGLTLFRELAPALGADVASWVRALAKLEPVEEAAGGLGAGVREGAFQYKDTKTGARRAARVSLCPTAFGDKLVIHLPRRSTQAGDLASLGMARRTRERFRDQALDGPGGLMLFVGPPGSGKTATLYACIEQLKGAGISISTLEDPIESVIPGVAQCSVEQSGKEVFDHGMQALIRQDPDVLVVGALRERAATEAAMQAALSGQKVLSTFNAEDSASALPRLLGMEVRPFLLASAVVGVLAQRLVRGVCVHCAERHQPSARDLKRVGWTPAELAGGEFRQGRGCRQCNFTGYSGQIAVFELLLPNDEIREALVQRAFSSKIRGIGIQSTGLVTLLEDGLAKAAQGITTIEEVAAKLPRVAPPRAYREILELVGDLDA